MNDQTPHIKLLFCLPLCIVWIVGLATGCVVDDVVGAYDGSPLDADNDPEGCQTDTSEGPQSALAMSEGSASDQISTTGFICPVGDEDWYQLLVPDDHQRVEVTLYIRGPVSPVQPTFAILECDLSCPDIDEDPADCCQPVFSMFLPDEGLNQPLCVPQGEYFLIVSDYANDNEDKRHPRGEYVASFTTSPDDDPNEPNNDALSSAHLHEEGDQSWIIEGRISCRGDEDWFTLDESDGADFSAGGTLTVSLDLQTWVSYQPQLRILDRDLEQIGVEVNLDAPLSETHLTWSGPIGLSGPYYFIVADDDGAHQDLAPYELSVSIIH